MYFVTYLCVSGIVWCAWHSREEQRHIQGWYSQHAEGQQVTNHSFPFSYFKQCRGSYVPKIFQTCHEISDEYTVNHTSHTEKNVNIVQ